MQIHFQNWQKLFWDEVKVAKRLRIVSPFVNEQLIRRIGSKFDMSKLELVTRFKLADFALGVSSLSALRFCVENNARVFGIKSLHSKVYLFDERAAIISSANLTNGGLINNYECGAYTSDNTILEKLTSYFEQLVELGGRPLTLEQCVGWENKIADVILPRNVLASLPDFGASNINIDNARRYFVKFLGNSKNRVPLSFSTKEEIDRALCHYACGFSAGKKPRQISDGDVIYIARMTEHPNDFAIFGRAEAIAFDEERDVASAEEILQRPWKKDWPYYLRLKNPVFVDGTMNDCVLLYDLIRSLDYLSFRSTRDNYEKGEGNIQPSRSLTQQPYVELTQNAVEWLEPRFQSSLEQQGQVSERFLGDLPQSIEI